MLIRVFPEVSGRVIIEGSCASTRTFSFRDSYADVLGLGARISDFKLFDSTGSEIQVQRIAPGQYEAAAAATRFRYQVSLAPPNFGSDAAKVSWLNAERGLLLPGDLWPIQAPGDARTNGAVEKREVRFELPTGWSIYSNEQQNRTAEYEVADPDGAVFVVGNHLRTLRASIAGMSVNLVIDGDWAFTDSEASELISKVLKGEREVFGAMPARQTTFILLPFQSLIADKWSAETRGRTVTLLLGKIPSKIGALAQLSTPVTHESFHLWIPNSLALEGDYDWFYEGFTVYEAARVAVHLDLLMFPEFLRAMARAYDAYLGSLDRDRWSLIEYSRRRWTGGQSAVYQKSMLVAFLYDLKLRHESRGKRSLDDVYRDLIKEYTRIDSESAHGRAGEANDAVLRTLGKQSKMLEFGDSYIKNALVLDLEKELAPFGLKVERAGLRTHLSVSENLDKQQRDLLRQLGYNDVTRSGHSR
jgi:predicted metalloprotease with PDZ domain